MSSKLHVVTLPGDGTGPEVMVQGVRMLRAACAATGTELEIEEIECGGKFFLKHGSRDWPEGAQERCAAADVVFLGAVGWNHPDGKLVTMKDGKMAGYSPVIGNRLQLDLYANIRPVKLYPGVSHRIHGKRMRVWEHEKVDMVFIRENTEGLYSGSGGILAPGGKPHVATDVRVITREASERVIRRAFELARTRNGAPKDGKKRVTAIVKDNVLRGCQLFRDVFLQVGTEYPDIEKDLAIVDAFTQWLIGQPEFYDVLVTTNMFGDIVTDLASVLQGGMGMAVGCNTGDHHAMFEPIHGSAPKHAGKDKVNPIAMILAVREGLRWVGGRKGNAPLVAASDQLELAVRAVLERGEPLTYDLAGEERAAPMSKVGDAILEELKARLA